MSPLEFPRAILAHFSTAPLWMLLLTKATLVLAVAWVIHFSLARANPRWRILLWRGTVVGLVVTGVWIPGLPGLEIRMQTPEPVSTAPASSLQPILAERGPAIPAAEFVHAIQDPVPVEMTAATHQTSVEVLPEAARPIESSEPWLSWRMALLGIWAFGVALLVIRLAIALVRLARLLRTSQAVSEEITAEVGRIATALGCRRAVQVRTLRKYAVPFQYGLLRPVLVLPERMCQPAYRGQLPGVIAHELAHVQSWDFGWNVAVQMVSTILWFHPLAWRIGSVHRAACDCVCDAVSACFLGDVQGYCRTLVQIALEGTASFPALGLAMVRTCDVRRRITLLQQRVFAAALSRRAVIGIVPVGLLASVLLAGVRFAPGRTSGPNNGRQIRSAVSTGRSATVSRQGPRRCDRYRCPPRTLAAYPPRINARYWFVSLSGVWSSRTISTMKSSSSGRTMKITTENPANHGRTIRAAAAGIGIGGWAILSAWINTGMRIQAILNRRLFLPLASIERREWPAIRRSMPVASGLRTGKFSIPTLMTTATGTSIGSIAKILAPTKF